MLGYSPSTLRFQRATHIENLLAPRGHNRAAPVRDMAEPSWYMLLSGMAEKAGFPTVFSNVVGVFVSDTEMVLEFQSHFPGVNEPNPADPELEVRVVLPILVADELLKTMTEARQRREGKKRI